MSVIAPQLVPTLPHEYPATDGQLGILAVLAEPLDCCQLIDAKERAGTADIAAWLPAPTPGLDFGEDALCAWLPLTLTIGEADALISELSRTPAHPSGRAFPECLLDAPVSPRPESEPYPLALAA